MTQTLSMQCLDWSSYYYWPCLSTTNFQQKASCHTYKGAFWTTSRSDPSPAVYPTTSKGEHSLAPCTSVLHPTTITHAQLCSACPKIARSSIPLQAILKQLTLYSLVQTRKSGWNHLQIRLYVAPLDSPSYANFAKSLKETTQYFSSSQSKYHQTAKSLTAILFAICAQTSLKSTESEWLLVATTLTHTRMSVLLWSAHWMQNFT